MTLILYLIFFLSGVAALLFETLWFHQAGLTLGNSIWASSLVLASFMGGLAIGNGLIGRVGHRIQRPVRLYVWLEVAIGITGLALVYALPRLTPALAPLLRPFLDDPWMLNALRFGIVFPLLLLPATAMGATLPLLVGALYRRDPNFGRVLGRLYGWNTLGAVIGAMLGEVALIEWLGIRGTGIVAASMNGVAALVAFRLSRSHNPETVPGTSSGRPVTLSKPAVSLLIAACLFGAVLMALEVVWFRFLVLFIDGNSLAFSIMLSVVLAGIGLGGLTGSYWLSRHPRADRYLSMLALASGVLCIVSYVTFDLALGLLPGWMAIPWHAFLFLGCPLMFPVSWCSGMLFTLLGQALYREVGGEIRSAGFLTLANTTGAMIGALVAAFVFLPGLGIERSIRLLAGSYGLAAVFLFFGGVRLAGRRGSVLSYSAVCVLVLAYVFFPSGFMEQRYLLHRLKPYAERDAELPIAVREGLTETIIYLRRDRYDEPLYYRLVTNSHSMSATSFASQRYMKLFVYLPIAIHPNPKHALLISYGVGSTAKALTDTVQLETIDVVDTSRDIVEMSRLVYPNPEEHPLRDARVTVHIEDGRYFLQTTDRQFDLITGEPPPPKFAGIVNLYTREYFGLVWTRLAEGGIVTYWFPAHSLLERDAKTILRAFCDVFEDCSLWEGAHFDWILMGTRHAQGPVSVEQFTRQWRDPVVGPELRALGVEVPEQLGALFMADADHLREISHGTMPLSDDWPKRLSVDPMTHAERIATYRPWMDVHAARERFLRSRLIARFWPESMRSASLDYFDTQATINHFFLGEIDGPLAELPVFHDLLAHTSLRTPVLWLLGSSAQEQDILHAAVAKGRQDAMLDYRLGVHALADRDYARAEAHFRDGLERGTRHRELVYYRIYALCVLGRFEEARAVMVQWGVGEGNREDDRYFSDFLSQTFEWTVATSRGAEPDTH